MSEVLVPLAQCSNDGSIKKALPISPWIIYTNTPDRVPIFEISTHKDNNTLININQLLPWGT